MPVQKTLKLLMIFEATGCYCEMMLNKFCCGISNNSESNMFQYGNTPLNILSCQFRACLCRKLLMIFEATGRQVNMPEKTRKHDEKERKKQ